MTDSPTRDRLLAAAGELLAKSADVSTRAICDRAGVQAPTLYHHFGNKQGLLAAVVETRFTAHMSTAALGDDPVAALRESWDHHIRFGVANPNHYAMTGTIIPTAETLLTATLNEIARQGRLRTAPEAAARQLVAANVGATQSHLHDDGDPAWSAHLRDTLVAAIVTDTTQPLAGGTRSALAVGLLAALDTDPAGFTPGERALLREWLHRAATTEMP